MCVALTECSLLLPMDVPGSRAFSELGCFRLWFGLLSMASHVMRLKGRLLLLSSQCSPASYVRAVAVVWWMPRGSAFPSEPLFLQESETAELKLLSKPDWIQGSRSGSPFVHHRNVERRNSCEYFRELFDQWVKGKLAKVFQSHLYSFYHSKVLWI